MRGGGSPTKVRNPVNSKRELRPPGEGGKCLRTAAELQGKGEGLWSSGVLHLMFINMCYFLHSSLKHIRWTRQALSIFEVIN